MSKRSRQPITYLTPTIPLSLMFIIFFSFILLFSQLLIPPTPPPLPGPRRLTLQPFFPPALSHSLIHSISFSLPLLLRLSGHPLLFYNSQCNGSNVKEKSPAAFPPVDFTIKVFDQFVAGASDRASTPQHYPQQVH